MMNEKSLINKLAHLEMRLQKIDKKLREIFNVLQDASHKLCHLIKQRHEDFYKHDEV